jgi:hypothetical protein
MPSRAHAGWLTRIVRRPAPAAVEGAWHRGPTVRISPPSAAEDTTGAGLRALRAARCRLLLERRIGPRSPHRHRRARPVPSRAGQADRRRRHSARGRRTIASARARRAGASAAAGDVAPGPRRLDCVARPRPPPRRPVDVQRSASAGDATRLRVGPTGSWRGIAARRCLVEAMSGSWDASSRWPTDVAGGTSGALRVSQPTAFGPESASDRGAAPRRGLHADAARCGAERGGRGIPPGEPRDGPSTVRHRPPGWHLPRPRLATSR